MTGPVKFLCVKYLSKVWLVQLSCCLQNPLIICVWENHGKGYLNNFPITEFKANTCLFQSESNIAIMDSIPGFKKNYKLITYSYFNIFIPYFFSADFIDCYPTFHIHHSKSVFYFLSSYIIFLLYLGK